MLDTVLNIDCMEVLPLIDDNFFDLAVVDPPYGIGAPAMNMGTNGNRKRGNGNGPAISTAKRLRGSGVLKNRLLNNSNMDWDIAPTAEYFAQLFRVSKNQVIWGGNYFHLPPTRCVVCWDKMQPWENFSQWEMAWTSFDMPAPVFRISNTGGANKEKKIHPTQKPVALYDQIYKKFAKPGQRILDTHLGSGTNRIAADRSGMIFTGYEINKDFFEKQEVEFKKYKQQLLIPF